MISGVLLVLAFPQVSWGLVGFVALIPLFITLNEGRRPARWTRAFLKGYLFGLTFFTGLLFWVVHVTVLGTLLLIPYVALYPGAFAVFADLVNRRTNIPFSLSTSLLWTAYEFIRTRGFLGFPWGNIGYVVGFYPVLIQGASYTSVLGISFWIVLVNGLILETLQARGWRRWVRLGWIVILWVGSYGYGRGVLDHAAPSGRTVKVALVQGNIDQDVKWDQTFLNFSFEQYIALTRSIPEKVDLIVWPETAAPTYLVKRPYYKELVADLAQEMDTPILTGANDLEWVGENTYRVFNSAFLFDPHTEEIKKFDKIHLVPFGERMPLVDRFPFLERVQLGQSNFTPGTERVLFQIPKGRFPALICFEAVFPDEVRAFVKEGADFLVNITNDAWFGRYSAPYQHAQMAVFRAVENRISLARCANTGVSYLADPWGRIQQATKIFEDAMIVGEIPLREEESFYTRHGDVFPWVCFGLAVAMVGMAAVRRGDRAEGEHCQKQN